MRMRGPGTQTPRLVFLVMMNVESCIPQGMRIQMVDFADSPEQQVFRASVEEFFSDNFPEALEMSKNDDPRTMRSVKNTPAKEAALKEWRTALVDKGWIAPKWLKGYGGAGLDPIQVHILDEEAFAAGMPRRKLVD